MRSGQGYDRDEDHLAQFIELLGKVPRKVHEKGKYARDYFNRSGDLRHIKRLRMWPLDRVLTEKYHVAEDEVRGAVQYRAFDPSGPSPAVPAASHI